MGGSGAAEHGDSSTGSQEDRQGCGCGLLSSGAGEFHFFCGSAGSLPWSHPCGSLGKMLCPSTLLPPEWLIPEKEVEEESCSAFNSPLPKRRKTGDEGGGGSHSHKLGARCYWNSLLSACLRERWQEVKIPRSTSSTATFSRMLALQVSEAASLGTAWPRID